MLRESCLMKFRCYEAKIEVKRSTVSRSRTQDTWVGARCATEAFSTTSAVHIEDCEGWWLSGWSGSVILVAQARDVLGSTPGFNSWQLLAFLHNFVPLYILSYLVPIIYNTHHMLWKDTTEPTIELICLHSAAWATALIYTKGPMTAAAQNGYSSGEVPGELHTMYHAGYIADVTHCN